MSEYTDPDDDAPLTDPAAPAPASNWPRDPDPSPTPKTIIDDDDAATTRTPPGNAVLESTTPALPDPEPLPPDERVAVPLDPLDSDEAWKEKERVPTGDSNPPGQPGAGGLQDPIEAAHNYGTSGTVTVSETPDGDVVIGSPPNAVVVTPDGIPAPVHPQSTAEAHQDRVLYENMVNAEAEAFADTARLAYIEARVQGKTVEVTEVASEEADDLEQDPEVDDPDAFDHTEAQADPVDYGFSTHGQGESTSVEE